MGMAACCSALDWSASARAPLVTCIAGMSWKLSSNIACGGAVVDGMRWTPLTHRIARDTGDEVALKVINLEDVYVYTCTDCARQT